MDNSIRDQIFSPILNGNWKALVPDFKAIVHGKEFTSSAQVTVDEGRFKFEMHLLSDIPDELKSAKAGFYGLDECLIIRGQINGEIAFECSDVFPPSSSLWRSRGTSVVRFGSGRMNLLAEGVDALGAAEMMKLLGEESESSEEISFSAHLIYHGPQLKLRDAGSEVISKNDFLGEASSSSFDTHLFSGKDYEAALIQKDKELHLHLRSKDGVENFSADQILALVDNVNAAIGFCLGFNPWPAYREVRRDHVVVERWISPKDNLPSTYFIPITERMYGRRERQPEDSIIAHIADGLRGLPLVQHERLATLLWHMRSNVLSELPPATRLLIVCALLDSMTKLVCGLQPDDKPATDKTWRKASDTLGLSWESWTRDIFELWGKYRHKLSHGWLWLDEVVDTQVFYKDYPRLVCAFNLLVACLCGFRGRVLAYPYSSEIINITEILAVNAQEVNEDR